MIKKTKLSKKIEINTIRNEKGNITVVLTELTNERILLKTLSANSTT